MGKISKDAYLTGICSILAAIVGAWCGNAFAQDQNIQNVLEIEALTEQYVELQKEYGELSERYQELVLALEEQEEGIDEDSINMSTVNETKKVKSLFELDMFTPSKTKKVTYIKDVFGNEYSEAYEVRTTAMNDNYLLDYATEFFLDGMYKKFSCKVVFPETANEVERHQIIIWGDGKQLGVVTIEKKSGTQSIEIDVKDVKFLQFVAVTEERHSNSSLGIIEPYLE